MKKQIDFRKSGTQVFDGFCGRETITYRGQCPVTGIRLYESDGSNDPRGILGAHAIHWFVASEYDMAGPDVVASWLACNNNQHTYKRALEIAKKQWEPIE